MGKKIQKINVVIIDDETSWVETIYNAAARNGIELTHCTNLEEGMNTLESSKKYLSVILDGYCLVNKDEDVPSKSFLSKAFKKIDALIERQDRFLLPVINTAFDEYSEYFSERAQIFDKKSQTDELFTFIRSETKKSPEMQIKNKHVKVFEIFESGYLLDNVELKLLSVIKSINDEDPSVIQANLSLMRTIIEAVKDKLYAVDPNISQPGTPAIAFLKNLAGNWDYSAKRPTSNQYMPKYICDQMVTLYTIASETASHHSNLCPTKYTVKAMENSLLEFLLWFKNWMDDNN